MNSDDFFTALHAAFNVRWPASHSLSPAIRALLDNARERGLRIDPVLGVFEDGMMRCAGAVVESPGRAAILFLSHDVGHCSPDRITSNVDLAAAMANRAWTIAQSRDVRLMQMLTEPDDTRAGTIAARAGFLLMTQLIYLRRECHVANPAETHLCDLNWEVYSSANETLFLCTLELTYEGSLDCPEIFGLRSTADVLATHRASGEFLPACWWVARRGEVPVGVVLLNGVREPFGLEVVYMGVAQPARGTGVADRLLARAMACATSSSAKYVTLAVDARNTPAIHLYRRWGFQETHRLNAWIATPRSD